MLCVVVVIIYYYFYVCVLFAREETGEFFVFFTTRYSMSRQRRGRASSSSSSSTLANVANIFSSVMRFERIESSAKALSVRVKQQFLLRVVGGKKNLKRFSREIIGREIKRRKWIENFLLGTKLKRKYLTEDEVLTLLMFGFLVAAIALVLFVRWVFRMILGQNRNVGNGEEEEEEKQETIKRDYSRSVTMHEDSFTVDDFTPEKKKKKQKSGAANTSTSEGEKSPLVKRVSIDETVASAAEEEKTKKKSTTTTNTTTTTTTKTTTVAKEQPMAFESLITTEERAKIAELRQLVNKEKDELLCTDALKMYCSDAQLARNLRARKWDVLKAFEMLKKTLLWRKEYKPESITFEDIEEELRTGKQYRSGRDRFGRRIIVMRPSRENTREHDGNIRLLVYTFENALWRTNGERIVRGSSNIPALAQEQICVLINFTKWSLKLSPPWRTSMETLHIMQEHYPERLGLAVCYDPPSVFSVFWKLISPFIDVKTKSKIRFVQPRGDKQKAAKKMNEMFHPNTIDSDMGGRVDATWDLDEYKVFLKRYDEVKKNVFETLKKKSVE